MNFIKSTASERRLAPLLLAGHKYMSSPKLFDALAQGDALSELGNFVGYAAHFTAGRLRRAQLEEEQRGTEYKPVGYILSVERDREETVIASRKTSLECRSRKLLEDAKSRLVSSRGSVR